MIKCFCDACGKDITDRQSHFRVDFTYFGDDEQLEKEAGVSFDLCRNCVGRIKDMVYGITM